jgi:predicted ribosomally synthesized peptide with SipW-like signal peptide
MTKIIKSLAIVIAIGAIAVGATWSFFSDEEKSTGNTFTAGKIDLKVDSESHYNGMVCRGGQWIDPICNINQVSNWDFEKPIVASGEGWDIYPQSQTDWYVEWMPGQPTSFGGYNRPEQAQLEYHRNVAGSAESGQQYVELDSDWNGHEAGPNGEPASVRIYQDVPTVSGKDYTLSFWFSRRPGADSANTNKMRVTWGGAEVATNITGDATDGVHTNWKQYTYTVHATASTMKLAFEDIGTADSYGTYLDNVSLVTKTCDTAPGEVQTCDGTWDLTDIGAQKFFNFSDIKPGDFGEDTVSLHVYDNDAWGRMIVDVKKDSDGTCVDPEVEVEGIGCVENGTNNGELRKNLDFSVWLDEGVTPGFQGKTDKGEGDNIKQEGEIELISAGPIDLPKETWNIKDAILAAYAANGNAVAPGITADGHMTADVTYYFGLGWKLPKDTGNEAQTDIFEADVTLEVEQYRNNPNPF